MGRLQEMEASASPAPSNIGPITNAPCAKGPKRPFWCASYLPAEALPLSEVAPTMLSLVVSGLPLVFPTDNVAPAVVRESLLPVPTLVAAVLAQ